MTNIDPVTLIVILAMLCIVYVVCLVALHYRNRAKTLETLYDLVTNDHQRLQEKTYGVPEMFLGKTYYEWITIEAENKVLKYRIDELERSNKPVRDMGVYE